MPNRRPVRRTVRSANRRRVIWAQYNAQLAMTANAQWFTVDLLSAFKAATGSTIAKATIVRTHLSVAPVAAVANDRYWLGLGVYDVDDISNAVTVNAFIRNPHDNPYSDWALSSQVFIDGFVWAHPSGVNTNSGGVGVDADIRAKRKLENVNDTWGFCLYQENVTTVAKTYNVFARTLLALA